MKKIGLFIFVSAISFSGYAQLKATPTCPPFSVDVLGGTVNKLNPRSTAGEVEKVLPCFSEKVVQDEPSKCIGVYFADQGVYFYTGRNYIEIRSNYKGAITLPIGTPRSSLFSILGGPKMKDKTWEAYQTEYGILILYFDSDNKVNKIQMSTKGTDTIKLCE